ncbi:MAG: N-acetyl-gamma-glutamyl-phosphate reductase, partial [Candidatus Dormibacteraceae bacterium]
MSKIRAAVVGASGYTGITLVNLLSRHPGVELSQLVTRSLATQLYSSLFPLLDLEGSFTVAADPKSVDVIFSCLPHNQGAQLVAGWRSAGARVVDLSADFRLRDATLYPRWYQQSHP